MAFTTKIGNYVGDLTGLDSANALKQAVDYTLGMAKQLSPAQWLSFSNKVKVKSSIAGIANKYNLRTENVYDVIKVVRDYIDCRATPPDQRKKIEDIKSIYFATKESPTYSIDYEGGLTIIPDTGNPASDNGEIYVVFSSDRKTISDSAETIKDDAYTKYGSSFTAAERFPDHWKDLVILHASELLLVEKLSLFRSTLPTDLDDTTVFDKIGDIEISISGLTKALPSNFTIATALPSPTVVSFPTADMSDPLDKAQRMIDAASTIGGDDGTGGVLSVQQWLEDEDEDMVNSTIQTITAELSRAQMILSEYSAKVGTLAQDYTQAVSKYTTEIQKEAQRIGLDISEYQAEIQHALQLKQNELQEYSTNLGKKMSSYTTLIQKINTDYGWVTQQLQVVGGKKQEFQQVIASSGVSDNPAEKTI